MRVRKVQIDATAPGAAAGANVIELTPAIALTGTANTNQNVAASTPQIAAGDRIALNFSGTLTGLVGNIQLEVEAA